MGASQKVEMKPCASTSRSHPFATKIRRHTQNRSVGSSVPVTQLPETHGYLHLLVTITSEGSMSSSQMLIRETDRRTGAMDAPQAKGAFGLKAEALARELCGDVLQFAPGRNLTTLAEWYVTPDDARLIVVVGDDQPTEAMDEVLAYSLSWQGDRDLVLILPETHAPQTLSRLPWVDSPVRVFVNGPGGSRAAVIPSRSEMLAEAGARPLRRTSEHDLAQMAESVEALTSWASSHWAMTPVRRPGLPSF